MVFAGIVADHAWRGCASDRRGMPGASSWREPPGGVVPVAASYLSSGKPASKTWLNCEDRRRSRHLARLRLGPTRHARRLLLARTSRGRRTCRSLVPVVWKPASKTWLNCEDRRRSRHLARLRLGPTRHARRLLPARTFRAPRTRRSLVPPRRNPVFQELAQLQGSTPLETSGIPERPGSLHSGQVCEPVY